MNRPTDLAPRRRAINHKSCTGPRADRLPIHREVLFELPCYAWSWHSRVPGPWFTCLNIRKTPNVLQVALRIAILHRFWAWGCNRGSYKGTYFRLGYEHFAKQTCARRPRVKENGEYDIFGCYTGGHNKVVLSRILGSIKNDFGHNKGHKHLWSAEGVELDWANDVSLHEEREGQSFEYFVYHFMDGPVKEPLGTPVEIQRRIDRWCLRYNRASSWHCQKIKFR